MKSKWILWVVPIAAIVVFGAYRGGLFQNKANTVTSTEQITTIQTKDAAIVERQDLLELTGNIEAVDEALVSSKVAGKVAQISVENGDLVSAGAGLIQLESQDYQNQLTISEAGYKKAQNALESTKTDYERFQSLAADGALTQVELEGAKLRLDLAETDAASAAAAVQIARDSLANTLVKAPISGVAADKTVLAGQMLSPGVPLISIKDISSVYVVVNIKQGDMAKIKPGMKAVVTVDAYPGKSFSGTVEIINPVAKASARVFETKIKIKNANALLKPGMFAKAKISVGEPQKVLAVPSSSLTGIEGMYFVFLVDGNTVKRQEVEIGASFKDQVEIKSGLEAGQKVSVTNVNKLKDQDKIKVAD